MLKRISTSELKIYKTIESDSGLYTCRIQNEHGYEDFCCNVTFLPKLIDDIGYLQVETVEEVGYFKLSVRAVGGTGEVAWLKDGIKIKEEKLSEGQIGLRVKTGGGASANDTFYICVKDCKVEDSGVYQAYMDGSGFLSSACKVLVIPWKSPTGVLAKDVSRKLSTTWHLADSLLCLYCHTTCATLPEQQTMACRFCAIWFQGRTLLICKACQAHQTHCR